MNINILYRALCELAPNANFEINENGDIKWKSEIKQPTDEEIEAKIKELEEQEKIKEKYNSCKNYIYQYYPIDKQGSDQADKEYYSTLLKAKGVENLETDIVARVEKFFAGSTLDDVVADVADENKEAYLQLIKVGIRVTWVQRCKEELKKAIAENREPVYPEYPL